jgi:hypothetical protein
MTWRQFSEVISAKRFKGIYWRQLWINVGMVALTLVLLGTSFFSLTYSYILSEKRQEMVDKAEVMAEKAEEFVKEQQAALESSSLDPSGYRKALSTSLREFRERVRMSEEISNITFLIWIPSQGNFISVDDSLDGTELTLPAAMGDKLAQGEIYAGTTDLGYYDDERVVVAIPAKENEDGEVLVGPILAVAEPKTLTGIWRDFVGIFAITAVTVLLIAFVASATTTVQQTKPIKDMASAARRFAEGNFDAS